MSKTSCVLLIALTILLGGCAHTINRHTASKYADQGDYYIKIYGAYGLAERSYSKALLNCMWGRCNNAAMSLVMYNLAFVKGKLCKWEDAESFFEAALEKELLATGPDNELIALKAIEFARFYYDRDIYPPSLPYFEQGIHSARVNKFDEKYPGEMIELYDEYALALEKSGDLDKAAELKKAAETLRTQHPDIKPHDRGVSYTKTCTKADMSKKWTNMTGIEDILREMGEPSVDFE